MRRYYLSQLEALNHNISDLGLLCEEIITQCKLYMDNNNNNSIYPLISSLEKKTNEKERDIETLCLNLLLHQQPVASDLRLISASLKLISDLERIGDQAYDISTIIKERNLVDEYILEKLKLMAKETAFMVSRSVKSFVTQDLSMSYLVIENDDIVDELFQGVREQLSVRIQEDSSRAEEYLNLLLIAKYLERIGDHAVNVAEWAIFSLTGKHPLEFLEDTE